MRRLMAAFAAILVLLTPSAANAAEPRYTNPVSADFADTFADPVIVRGDDGLWYAYGTTDPLREGEGVVHRIPMARSGNLVDWTYLADAFAAGQRPAFAAAEHRVLGSRRAPPRRPLGDVRDGHRDQRRPRRVRDRCGHRADAGRAVDVQRRAGGGTPARRPAAAGSGPSTRPSSPPRTASGTCTTAATSAASGSTSSHPDGLRITGEATRVAIDNKFEGAYVVLRGGWYYLFASSANCCAGPTTGYSVSVGRSRDPRGPFVDRTGQSLNVSRAGGTPVVAPNGNRWVGTGHNGLITDLAGQDWLVYHAIDRADPYLDGPSGINERPMLLDRLDWIGGWPTVRAGAWASEEPTAAPVTRTPVQDGFATLSAQAWRVVDGQWAAVDGRLRGDGTLVARTSVGADLRAEADLRGPAGLTINRVTVRAQDGDLVIQAGSRTVASTALPAGFDTAAWHHLSVERARPPDDRRPR